MPDMTAVKVRALPVTSHRIQPSVASDFDVCCTPTNVQMLIIAEIQFQFPKKYSHFLFVKLRNLCDCDTCADDDAIASSH
jgi:hypothetical protein